MTNTAKTTSPLRTALLTKLTEKELQVIRAIPVAGDFGPEGQGNYTSDIARHLKRNGKSIGGTVASLVKKGFVTQQETDYGPENRHDSWLMFTEVGQAMYDHLLDTERRQAQSEKDNKVRIARSEAAEKRFTEVLENLIPDTIFFDFEETTGVKFGRFHVSSLFSLSVNVETSLVDQENIEHRFASITVDRGYDRTDFAGKINWSAWGNQDIHTALLFAEGLKAVSNIAADLEASANEIWSSLLEEFPLTATERRILGVED